MNLDPCPHPHVNEYVRWPNELTLYFSGSVNCSIPLWSWALMDATDLYASDRGHEKVKTEKTHIWAATVGLGKALAFLNERKWRGKLLIKSHLKDCNIFSMAHEDSPMMRRCRDLLASINWDTEVITSDENEFACCLVRQAYEEYKQ